MEDLTACTAEVFRLSAAASNRLVLIMHHFLYGHVALFSAIGALGIEPGRSTLHRIIIMAKSDIFNPPLLHA